ncbi:MAG: DUF4832 domain-containing protein [Bacteroidales bacterium]|nr:DUF4832 domain-containing protein [Bacteroidales bacterium]
MRTSRILPLLATLFALSLTACFSFFSIEDNEEEGQEQQDKPAPAITPEEEAGFSEITYEETSGNVINPERGFYYPYDFKSSSRSFSASDVKSKRKAGHTVLLTQYVMSKWMSSDIPDSFLKVIQGNFDALRSGGAKCVLRFCYNQSYDKDNPDASKPWDPEEKWVMRHIEQLKPLLQANEDVIMVFQAGFVGVWGEWYYTDHFVLEPQTAEDYLPRKRVLEAMLDALPESRQVAVRTPDFKLMMYGLALGDTLTAKTAHNGTVLSRIGGYNDCFGAAEDDWGTYLMDESRPFWAGDTRYTFMGGETCAVSDYCTCPVSLSDMEKYHWTYLNIGYNTSVINRWKTQGCYDEITRRLGYRIVLENIKHTSEPQAGKPFRMVIYLRNDGFSAFQNPRDAKLVFVSADGKKSEFPLGSDPRTWHPGSHRIEAQFTLPSDKGTLYLHLADPLLPDRPEYSAALANSGVWESGTGYNLLLKIK